MYKVSKYSFFTSRTVGDKTINLVLSGRTGKNIVLPSLIYNKLIIDEIDSIDIESKNKLIEQEVLVESLENEFDKVNDSNRDILVKQKEATTFLYVSFQTSAYCQLACDYCGQEHERVNMSDEIIDSIVCRIEEKLSSGRFKGLTVSWFGGEPLFAMKQMRIINTKLKQICLNFNLAYEGKITTNGLCLTPKLYKELIDDFNIGGIEITLDGTSEYHDARRYTKTLKPSFNVIFNNLKGIINSEDSIYKKERSFISIRCNVDQRNMTGVIPLLDLFVANNMQHKIYFYTANVFSWAQNGADKNLSVEEYSNHCLDYLIYLKKKGFNMVNLLPNRTPPAYCMALNENAEMFDSFGNIFDCSETSYSSLYENTDLILGNIHNVKNNSIKRSRLINYFEDLKNYKFSKCSECKFYPLCGGGCAKAMYEEEPRCPAFIYNIENRMLLDFLLKDTIISKAIPNEIHSNIL